MLKVYIEYCLDGFNLISKEINSTDTLIAMLHNIKLESLPVIKGIFCVDVVIENVGRLSVGLDEKSVLMYISADFEDSLTSLGDESAEGETMYYSGDYTLLSNKYIISFTEALEALKIWINKGELSDSIKWTSELF